MKPDHLICCINVIIEEAGIFSLNDWRKGYELTEQNFVQLAGFIF